MSWNRGGLNRLCSVGCPIPNATAPRTSCRPIGPFKVVCLMKSLMERRLFQWSDSMYFIAPMREPLHEFHTSMVVMGILDWAVFKRGRSVLTCM